MFKKAKIMIKITVLYGHPTDAAMFEHYYSTTHLALVGMMKGYEKAELTKFLDAPDGTRSEYYRMAEFWFANIDAMQATMGSPEGQATAADIANFATGGVKILTGVVG